MVEQVAFQTIFQFLQTVGILVGVYYYISTIRSNQRNQQMQLETRQAQLFMNLYQTFSSPEFIKNWDHVNWRLEFEDWEDAFNKIHPTKNPEERAIWFSVGAFFEGVGVLVRRNLIDISLVNDLLGNMIKMTWEKMGPIEKESRIRLKNPDAWNDFEYVYNEILRYTEDSPGSGSRIREEAKQYME
jgi:hypothetical protein